MSTQSTPLNSAQATGFTADTNSNVRWFVCFLLFLATTINYMDR